VKPANLLFILSDEHSRRVLGCYGHGMIRTPNLDRLAASGVRFSDAYCNSPICVPSRAALATALAAKIYGLKILKKDVADAKHNTTRFVVLARKPKWAGAAERHVITTFVFEVRNIPAALYKALGGFATNGINMTKLESYMVDGSFSATRFYADVDGHPRHRALELALEELEFVSQPKSLKILGVYPAHRYRETFK